MSSSHLPLQESTAFLSTRLSIAWLPDTPSEPTETLVLTGTKYYVDLRISKADGTLDWGMAGVKEIVGGTKDKPKARFTNILDSHLPHSFSQTPADPSAPPALPDEGDFSLLPDGTTLESGTMANPLTSEPQAYEEIWAPVDVERGAHVLILRRVRKDGKAAGGEAFIGVCGEWAMAVWEVEGGGYGGWKGKKNAEWKCVWETGSRDGRAKVGWVGDWWSEKAWKDWREGDSVGMGEQEWYVLEHSLFGEGRPK